VVACPPLMVARPSMGDTTRKLPRVLWLFFRIVGGSNILPGHEKALFGDFLFSFLFILK
jgi:hypothetical protein